MSKIRMPNAKPQTQTQTAPAQDNAALLAEIQRLRQANDQLKSARYTGIGMKVSEKGALSIYGLGRFPVTLYREQWQKLLSLAPEIGTFIEAHRAEMDSKSAASKAARQAAPATQALNGARN